MAWTMPSARRAPRLAARLPRIRARSARSSAAWAYGHAILGRAGRSGGPRVGEPRRVQPPAHAAQLAPVPLGLVPRLRPWLRQAESRLVGFHRRTQLFLYPDLSLRLAERRTEALHPGSVLPQREILVQPQRLPGGLQRDVGIPVPIAPDPRAEPEEGGDEERRLGVMSPQGMSQIAVEPGQHLPQDFVEVEQAVADLVLDRRRPAPDFIALPDGGDVREDVLLHHLLLPNRQELLVQGGQVSGDPLGLLQNAPPLGFRRMRGEDQRDVQGVKQRLEILGCYAGAAAVCHRMVERPGPGTSRSREFVLPELSGLVNLLGHVDELQEGGKRPDDLAGGRQVEALGQAGHLRLPLQGKGLPEVLAQIPDPFFRLEQRAARLLPEDVPQEIPKAADVAAQWSIPGGRVSQRILRHDPPRVPGRS